MKRFLKPMLALIMFIVCGTVYSCSAPNHSEKVEAVVDTGYFETDEQVDEQKDETIFVYICGEVNEAGVYEMPYGSRLYELVELAGGFTDEAACESLNLAKELSDSEKIVVPSYEELLTNEEDNGLVNINTAGLERLMTLPGIGEARAQDIIEYRSANGSFETIEDIKKVSGIKDSLYEKIKNLITVS